MKIAAYGILFGMIVVAIVQHACYWPLLPERVASHFGTNGQPDGWMSRTGFTLLMAGIQIGLPLFLAGLGRLVGVLPVSMVNIPNREYWFHPDRREATSEHMQLMLTWIAVVSSMFIAMIAHLTFLANRQEGSLNETVFVVTLVFYLIAVFGIAGKSLWRFRLPKDAARS